MVLDAAEDITEANRRAWNAQRYDAWVSAYGSPEVAAARIRDDPERVLRRLAAHLADVAGKRICSVQGSHGRVAVALALLGADVHVIDFAEENRRYALQLAEAAGVTIDYTVCDIMQAPDLVQAHCFDLLVLELGLLHYHQDLGRFFAAMRRLAADDGTLVLSEFHPVQRKLSGRMDRKTTSSPASLRPMCRTRTPSAPASEGATIASGRSARS